MTALAPAVAPTPFLRQPPLFNVPQLTLAERQTATHVWLELTKRNDKPVLTWRAMSDRYKAALLDADLQRDPTPWNRIATLVHDLRHWRVDGPDWALRGLALVAQAPPRNANEPDASQYIHRAAKTGGLRYILVQTAQGTESLGSWADPSTLWLFDPRSGLYQVGVQQALAGWLGQHMSTTYPDAQGPFRAIDLVPQFSPAWIHFLTNVDPPVAAAGALRSFQTGSAFSGAFDPQTGHWYAIAGQGSELLTTGPVAFRAERKGGHRQALWYLANRPVDPNVEGRARCFTLFWQGRDDQGRDVATIEWQSGVNEDNHGTRELPRQLRADVARQLSQDLQCLITDGRTIAP